jgi:outer membrane receptor protein involved in Fe transport
LEVDAGYRYSDYTTAGATSTYKVSGEWAPIRDVRFRGGYNRAVRAPNVIELYTPLHPNLFSANDPCAGSAITPANGVYAGCLLSLTDSGFSAAAAQALLASGQIPQCASGQCNTLVGGNPNLQPEKADTYTAGIVLQPHWVPGLSITVDYFNIKVTNVIESEPSVFLSQCVTTANPVYCAAVERDPLFGSLTTSPSGVLAPNINEGKLTTSGFDVDVNYRVRIADFIDSMESAGNVTFNFVGTYTSDLSTTPIPGQGSFNCVGLFGATCGTPTPYWRSKFRITWAPSFAPFTLSAQWRFIGGVGLDANHLDDPFFVGGAPTVNHVPVHDFADARIGAFNYFDLSGTWRVKDKITFRAGVNNIFGTAPPVLSDLSPVVNPLPFGNGNTFPNVYDSLGRQIFVGVTADF